MLSLYLVEKNYLVKNDLYNILLKFITKYICKRNCIIIV